MKYEVIGWTNCEDGEYPVHKDITAPVSDAIVREIQKHGYLFGGDAHEDYLPVLNDGTCVSFFWRGWGGVMARAYGIEGDYSYMFAYMNSLLDPEKIKYPATWEVDDSKIVSKESLAETFVMHLNDDMFEAVKNGTKTVEVRLFDEKRRKVDIGDYIEFRRVGHAEERIKKRVADLFLEPTFREIFTRKIFRGDGKRVRKFSPVAFGCAEKCSVKAYTEGMYAIYDKAKEKKYGVIAFVLEPPHVCRTRFSVSLETVDYDDLAPLENELNRVADGFLRDGYEYFMYGFNDTYDADVNVMLRKTLKGLFGKEEALKEIQKKYGITMTLDIFAVIVRDCGDPKPRLSLDKDIIEFLYQAGVEQEFGYKII